jgi:hypothetical protein
VGEIIVSGPEPCLDLARFVRALDASEIPAPDAIRPWILRLAPGESSSLAEVCDARNLRRVDAIGRQLEELSAVRLPSGSSRERERYVERWVSEVGGRDAVGFWVYLPWEPSVTHLLGRDDYFDVIVSRNHDKITRREQKLLRTKRIGVVGLSVGGEAAVTVAQEHLCGEIVLADFDCLDLSNLNRLGASFGELGDNKARIVARRIAKIDPYVSVIIYEQGVTGDNMSDFLEGLDLLIEECDDLPTKHEIRCRARAKAIDVVFAADERGFLSIEPYSRVGELLPFHGRVEKVQPPRESFDSTRSFMKALSEWLGGWSHLSERSRRSLDRIGESLCGYPQLASEARFAAGQIGHVARRLLLGESLQPFIGNVDLDELVPSSSR